MFCENKARVLAVSGFSDSGKTTLCRHLVTELNSHGLKVVYVKHHHADLPPDKTGSDTAKLRMSGTLGTVLAAGDGLVIRGLPDGSSAEIKRRLRLLSQLFSDCDLLLVEGYKNIELPRIEVLSPDDSCSYYLNSSCLPLAIVVANKEEVAVPPGVRLFLHHEWPELSQYVISRWPELLL